MLSTNDYNPTIYFQYFYQCSGGYEFCFEVGDSGEKL